MKKCFRTIALILALAMICGLLPHTALTAHAADQTYKLWINGKQVHDGNKDDVLGDGGTFRYIPERSELIVYDSYASNSLPVIDNQLKEGLSVWLYGNIEAKEADAVIKSSTNLTINTIDNYQVNIIGKSNTHGIYMTGNATLTISNIRGLTVSGDIAICGPNSNKNTAKLVVRGSRFTASCETGTSGQAIAQFRGGITLDHTQISAPSGASVKNGAVYDSSGIIASTVSTEVQDVTDYRLNIDGCYVNSLNCSDVLEDGGSVKYDSKTRTLTLNNPKFVYRVGWVIDSYIDGLTIRGKAVISGESDSPMIMTDKTTINGDFTIKNTIGYAIEAYDGALTFAGGTSKITGVGHAVHGDVGVSFTGGDTTMIVTEEGTALFSEEEISLSGGAEILTPKKGKILHDEFDDWYVTDSKGNVAKTVRIAVTNKFEDVKKGTEYYNAVLWAAYHKPYQVTAGLDKTHFGPAATVTRAQAMTFFWAAMDRPKFKKANTQFVDVKKTDWFYKSVMWAVENGVTAGTDTTHFSPNKTCNRGEILAFFYAAVKKPKVKIANPYKDVSNQWYKKAALWANDMGIERGEKGKFNASTACTRASTVLYLYRFLERQDLDLE